MKSACSVKRKRWRGRDGFTVTGWAEMDELPEALEDTARRFALGVQWHPEADPLSAEIGALVEAARA